MKDDCLFCKLANGIFPTNAAYEDDDFKVIMDIAPAAKGHCLVLPKAHYDNGLVADEETYAKTMKLAAKMAKAVKKATNCDGINILQNNGVAAGQTVFHLHVHIIPRFDDDSVGLQPVANEGLDSDLAGTAKLINENIE